MFRGQLGRHGGKILLALLALGTSPLAAQQATSRWELEIRGPAGGENGDLRLIGATGRILLQHHDSAFQSLQRLQIGAGRIAFDLDGQHRHFTGTLTDTMMSGSVRDADGSTWPWEALHLDSRSTRWPVPPRITVRQLSIGSSDVSERVPSDWMSVLPTAARLESEYHALVAALGAPVRSDTALAVGARRAPFGLDAPLRDVVRNEMTRILSRPDLSPRMQQVFRPGGAIKVDIHDAAIDEARHYLSGFQFANAVRGLSELSGQLLGDSASVRERAWRLWQRSMVDSAAVVATIDSVQRYDPVAGASVRALLAGYTDAVAWWRSAVSLLLTQRWLDTPAGSRSPAQLMAGFWGVDSLPLPDLIAVPIGDTPAQPQLGALHVGAFLMRPRNGVAAEWLAGSGMEQALDAWRRMDWGEPLPAIIGSAATTIVSPQQEARARPAAFFGSRDAIRINPGIMPLYAVATIMHEWHHLLIAARRLDGPRPPAVRIANDEVVLRPEDPWLSEGVAEWATAETLRGAGRNAIFLRFVQVEKLRAIAASDPDDPHLLGLRLVDALADRMPDARTVRDLLVRSLHDLHGAAQVAGLAGNHHGIPHTLHRPANAAVIPEITFTWDEGLAFNIARRLIIPTIRSEP